jgi:transcriptional regulator with XRE-family HTH domain
MLGMESLGQQLKRARKERGDWSRAQLSHETARPDAEPPYIAEPTIEAIEIGKTKRPGDLTILRLGEALGVNDDVFPAYALARARRALDEWQVGEQALVTLAQLAQTSPTIVRDQMEQELDALARQVLRREHAVVVGKRDRPTGSP